MENAENAMVLLYDVCRLCLDEPGVINIFEPVDWTQDILNYTGIKVTLLDKLPQTICRSCGDIMTCVKLLKDIATANDEHLQVIKGSKNNQVLTTDSRSHLIILTPCTACENQNEPSESCSKHKSLKNKIVFESEDEGTSASKSYTEKHKRKRKSSSSKPENNAPKTINVRKDLFESSYVTSSSSRNSKPCSSSTDSNGTRNVTTSGKSSVEAPSSTTTTDRSKAPKNIKTLKVAGQSFNVVEYEYKCETCSKTYATPKKLYLHQLAHNKKFICPLDACCKKFATKGDLKKHIRSHTGEKPYKCDLCEQSFTQNSSLKAHKENIHVESHS